MRRRVPRSRGGLAVEGVMIGVASVWLGENPEAEQPVSDRVAHGADWLSGAAAGDRSGRAWQGW
jgi:hypothetical protein